MQMQTSTRSEKLNKHLSNDVSILILHTYLFLTPAVSVVLFQPTKHINCFFALSQTCNNYHILQLGKQTKTIK